MWEQFKGIPGLEFRPLHIFRYPGGKKWLSPYLLLLCNLFVRAIRLHYPWEDRTEILWLRRPAFLLEPFAGGAVVGLTLLNSNIVERLVLVEKDARVAAFWETALRDTRFAARVEKFRCTRKNVEDVCANPKRDPAFWTLVKNRCAVGGNLTGGLMKDISCRWNGKAHAAALRQISKLAPRIQFFERNGIEVLGDHANDPNAAAFVDPPYVEAGKGLYRQWEVDHAAIFEALGTWKGFWLMTYDNVPEIKRLVKKHRFVYREVPMRTNKGEVKYELLMRSSHIPYDPKERPRWKQTVMKGGVEVRSPRKSRMEANRF
jgi:DNA adenine methylase